MLVQEQAPPPQMPVQEQAPVLLPVQESALPPRVPCRPVLLLPAPSLCRPVLREC